MKTKTTQRTANKPQPEQLAKIRSDLQRIQMDAEFLAEWGVKNNHDLGKAAFEMELLGFKLRHLLWLRSHSQFNCN